METETAVEPGSDYAFMLETIEIVGEAGIDIVPLYFERFFANFPQEEGNFHNPASSKGSMVNEMVGMMLGLASGEPWVEMMMRNEVTTHRTYGDIALQRYRDGLDCLIDVLREAAEDRWRKEHGEAWSAQSRRLFAMIEKAY